MRLLKGLSSLFLLLSFLYGHGQELNATVQVNAQGVAQPDLSIFKTLETSMQEFLNNTKWTDNEYEDEEKITMSLVFVVNVYDNDRFEGNFQVSASRPVFNSTYSTPIFNYKDNDVRFEYVEYAPFFYNKNQYENNLLSLVSFYALTVIGIDADTFEFKGGESYHREAQQIVNLSQSDTSVRGWRPNDGLISRYRLNDDLLSDTYVEYRKVMYEYHLLGMDKFAEDPKRTKEKLKTILVQFEELNKRRPNSLLQRTFFDAKADEISRIYSDGPAVNIRDLKTLLQKLAPNQSSKWRTIRV